VAGVLAGITGTVGLASLVSYPALLAVGLPALDANVTNTTALICIAVGAVAGSRPELVGQTRRVARYGTLTLAGGSVGAVLLLTTPPGAFELLVPWLIAGAAVLLALQPRIVARRAARVPGGTTVREVVISDIDSGAGDGSDGDGSDSSDGSDGSGEHEIGDDDDINAGNGARNRHGGGGGGAVWVSAAERGWPVLAAVFGVGIYVGYFGAGGGVALLAVLALALPESLARVNAVKTVSSGFANVVAAGGFALFGPVHWAAVAPLAVGLLVGGAIGPAIVRIAPETLVRLTVATAALGLAISLAVRSYT
jgi:hypothetical protein